MNISDLSAIRVRVALNARNVVVYPLSYNVAFISMTLACHKCNAIHTGTVPSVEIVTQIMGQEYRHVLPGNL